MAAGATAGYLAVKAVSNTATKVAAVAEMQMASKLMGLDDNSESDVELTV